MLDTLPAKVSTFFDERAETEMLYRTLLPYLLQGFREGMRQGKEQTGSKRAAEDDFDAVVQSRLKRKALFHASLAIGTTKDELQGLLAEAVAEGQSVQQLGKAIDDYFALQSRKRSLVIARTELTDTINDGTLHTIQREGYPQKEWITNIDGRERPQKDGDFDHRSANGQIVNMNDPFTISGELAQHPGADTLSAGNRCNCRCRIAAAGMSDERKAVFLRSFLRAHNSLERTFVVRLQQEFTRQRRRILLHFPAP